MSTEPLSVLALFKTLVDAGTAIADTADASKRHAQLIEFQKIVIEAQTTIATLQLQNSALVSDKQELEKECVRLKDWSVERQDYELREIALGVFARVQNGFVGEVESAHKLCCNCFDKATRSTLQSNQIVDPKLGRMVKLVCPNGCPPIVFRHYHF